MFKWLSPLFTCISCRSRFPVDFDLQSFPLCKICREYLIESPPLCTKCGSPSCTTETKCRRPWISRPEIHSYSARYILLNSGYQVLRKWKVHRGRLFDRQILHSTEALNIAWRTFDAEAIVPIPQRVKRAWKMGGSRSEILAQWMGCEIQLPILKLLKPPPLQKRQAELGLVERLQNSISFEPDLQLFETLTEAPKRVILVDDFMTTGHTFRKAAQTLLGLGLRQVHVFCLGVRLSRFNLENHPHLMKR